MSLAHDPPHAEDQAPNSGLFAATRAADFLGPAPVRGFDGSTPLVEIEGRQVRAEVALAFPYEPAVDDELLVIGKDARFYVIGLLRARGQVALRFFGDVRLQAVGGKLELEGDEGVRVRGRSVEVVTRTFKTLADSVMERANDVYRRVRDTLDVHAGEKRELVDGMISTRAETIHSATSGVTSINGKEIHMS